MNLKKEYLDTEIWVPMLRERIVGRFIPANLHSHMASKFPELYEKEGDTKVKVTNEKKGKINDLYFKDAIASDIHNGEAE
jgi:hypothetical protein